MRKWHDLARAQGVSEAQLLAEAAAAAACIAVLAANTLFAIAVLRGWL